MTLMSPSPFFSPTAFFFTLVVFLDFIYWNYLYVFNQEIIWITCIIWSLPLLSHVHWRGTEKLSGLNGSIKGIFSYPVQR